MASITLNSVPWPDGATVTAYLRAGWTPSNIASPPGQSAKGTPGTVSNGSVTITGLTAGTDYYAIGQDASSRWRWVAFSTDSLSTGSSADLIPFTPAGSIAASTVQAAIEEVSTDSASAAADAADALDAVQSTALGQAFGTRSGSAIRPWDTPAPIGPELWTTSNFVSGGSLNSSTTSPSLVHTGGNLTKTTLVSLGNLANQDKAFRLVLDVTSIPSASTTWGVHVAAVGSGDTLLGSIAEQELVLSGSRAAVVDNPRTTFDFKAGSWATGSSYLRVRISMNNDSTAGDVLTIGASLKEVAAPQRPLLYGLGDSAGPKLWTPLFDPTAETWRMVETEMGGDGALTNGLTTATAYNTDRAFRYDLADPTFLQSWQAAAGSTEILLGTGEISRQLRSGNNDQVVEVQKADSSYELRGNTHGGETNRTAATWAADRGDGVWRSWDGTVGYLRTARRLRFTFPTKLTRSAPDSDDFANVDHVATFFPDGMMRMDRTTTFTKAVRLRSQFDWMSSHPTTVPAVGRIGAGTFVLDEVDVYPKLAVPAAPTVTPSSSGGTLPAGTRYYAITALALGGETTPGPVASGTTTGSTGSNALAWSAVSNSTGYRVWAGPSPSTLALLATVGSTTTSYTDTNAAGLSGQPPKVNTARRIDAASIDLDSAISDRATWAVWYDQFTNVCFGNIYDRDAVLNRTGVAGVKLRLEAGSSIRKNYLTVHWTGDGSPSLPDGETLLIANGTVWTATHWAFAYVPSDPVNYHREIAVRAANLSALKDLYPAT